MMKAHFETFARYNTWANRRLYEAAATLSDTALRQERPAAYFGSLFGTLNHLLLVDRMWLDRIDGHPARYQALDTTLLENLDNLRAEREAEDATIEARMAALDESGLQNLLVYETISMGPMRTPLHQVLSHFFNHQTHHRGQAHALLKEAGMAPPPLDLLFYLREAAQ